MAKNFKKESQFKTRWYHRMPRYWLQKDLVRPEGVRETPEVFRLDVGPGVKANRKPPVRIFLGTEAGQFRAERVFVWSVMQARDPARVYEIYFMKDLKGYDRTGWKTGFTNYRYGIPTMGGGKGRAPGRGSPRRSGPTRQGPPPRGTGPKRSGSSAPPATTRPS